MFLVNYLAGFKITPAVLSHHNTYCSYADTIMPQFFFAVGFAFRLTFGRRASAKGLGSAYFRAVRRFFGLALVAILFYTYLDGEHIWSGLAGDRFWTTLQESLKRTWFQTLMHIAVTALWILPVIRASVLTRIAYMVASAGLHVVLSWWFNVAWINSPPTGIDGGPLGFLTWCIPTMVGTLACDIVMNPGEFYRKANRLALWSIVIMLLGYGMSCGTRLYDVASIGGEKISTAEMVVPPTQRLKSMEGNSFWAEPPFVAPPDKSVRHENYWMMSQRYSTVSYQTFAAGFSLAVYLLFYWACDRRGWQLGVFRTYGRNALLGYILAAFIQRTIKRYVREHAEGVPTAWQVMAGFLALLLAVYFILRVLEWRRIFVRL
jgi:predicted acyltransferase